MNSRFRKVSVLLVVLLAVAGVSFARQAVLPKTDTSAVPAAWHRLSDAYRSQPGHLLFMPLKRLNYSSLFLNKQDGDYKMVQEPGKQKDYGMRTTGFVRLGKWVADGSFGYTRYRKDSTGLHFRSNIYDDAPFYLYSFRKGNWDEEIYTLSGNLATTWFNNKLQTAIGARFKTGEHTRSNDPRPEISNHQLQFLASLGYQLTPRHNVQVHATYGYGNESAFTDFASRQNSAPGQVEYAVHTMLGYGHFTSTDRDNANQLYEFNKSWGWGGSYLGRFDFGTLLVNGNYYVSEHRYRREYDRKDRSTNPKHYVGTYDRDGYSLDATFHTDLQQARQWIFTAGYRNDYGQNFVNALNGNNYIFLKNTWQVTADRLQFCENKLQWEAGLKWGYQQKQVIDGASKHELFVRNQLVSVAYIRYLPLKQDGTQLLLGIEPGVLLDLGSSLLVTGDTTIYTKQLLYPDYVYESQNNWQLKGTAGFQMRVGKQLLGQLSFQAMYRQPFEESVAPVADFHVPGGNRIFYTLQLRFYH